ncbi:MAG: DNA polymerase I [Clostridia bacterium]|nr:DNA polymerase I [Clostridia bacterium]
MKKMLVVDGNSIVNRAFFGIRPLSTKAGLPTNAVFGFLMILKKHLDALAPDFKVCAFDVHEPTFRHKAYADYKGNRKGMPDELKAQMPYAKRAAAALGFLVVECPGWEADDVIGTVAALGDERGDIETTVLTGDRDSLQLITATTSVMLAKTKEDLSMTPETFFEAYGVTPAQFVDVKALMGDSSDNIPGVAGIGEKTALKLIQTAGSLDALYAPGGEGMTGLSAGTVKKLEEGRESAYLSRSLSEIKRDAPVGDRLYEERPIDGEAFRTLCAELEFRDMPKRFGIDEQVSVSAPAAQPPSETRVTEAESFDALSFDAEHPAFLSYDGTDAALSVSEGETVLFKNADRDALSAFLRRVPVVCHDFKTLLRTLHIPGEGIDCRYDTMLAAYLLNPGKSKYLLRDAASEYGMTAPAMEGTAGDASLVRGLHAATKDKLAEAGMEKLLGDIEIPLSSVLASMEETGFRINPEGIRVYAEELKRAEDALQKTIWTEAGHEFNINSPKQLGEVLFEELGLPAGKKTKTGYSTDADTLEELLPYHTIVGDILNYRQIAKLRGTYGEPLIAQADEKGRIHTRLNQTGTATGRLASSDPNLQNIPVRMELGRELRKYFIAEDGYLLVDADYSQIELRLLSVLADDENMKRAFLEGEDIHTAVAAEVFGLEKDEVTPELRRRAKAVNFGIVYGIGDFSLSKDLGITRRQAKEYIENYLATYPGVDAYLKRTVAEAKENGWTTTMFGRRRNIPELKAQNRNLRSFGERVAMNSPIQGTAADVIKIAMIRVDRALREAGLDARLIMQVHDELIVEAREDCADEAAELLVREMENAVKLSVPLTADCGMGKSWYEAK